MTSLQSPDLFLTMIEKNKGIIYKIANSYCKDPEDRKDLIQEMVFQLWQSFGNYDQQHKQSTWMYRVALNVAISFYRKEARRKTVSLTLTEHIIEFIADESPSELEPQIRLLQQFINELKELDKALIILYLEQKSYKEISEVLGITETNVATKIGRIKDKIKQKFLSSNN